MAQQALLQKNLQRIKAGMIPGESFREEKMLKCFRKSLRTGQAGKMPAVIMTAGMTRSLMVENGFGTQSSQSTYSVSLCFDFDSSENILALQRKIAELSGNDFLIKNSVPPHITIGMFHATKNKAEMGELKKAFEGFAEFAGSSFELNFGGIDSFCEKVVFISVKKDSDSFIHLKKLNSALHEKMLKNWEPGANGNYLPEKWFPHVALAVKLTKSQYQKVMEIGGTAFSDLCTPVFHSKINAISLAECHPYTEICRIAL